MNQKQRKRNILRVVFSTLWAIMGLLLGWRITGAIEGTTLFMVVLAVTGRQITIKITNIDGGITQGMIINSIMTGTSFLLLSILFTLLNNDILDSNQTKIDMVWLSLGVVSATYGLGRDVRDVIPKAIRRALIGGISGMVFSVIILIISNTIEPHVVVELSDFLRVLGVTTFGFAALCSIGWTAIETIIIVIIAKPSPDSPTLS